MTDRVRVRCYLDAGNGLLLSAAVPVRPFVAELYRPSKDPMEERGSMTYRRHSCMVYMTGSW